MHHSDPTERLGLSEARAVLAHARRAVLAIETDTIGVRARARDGDPDAVALAIETDEVLADLRSAIETLRRWDHPARRTARSEGAPIEGARAVPSQVRPKTRRSS